MGTPFSPSEYALARGWDFGCIEDTARLGVSPEDHEALVDTWGLKAPEKLLAWCKQTVAEKLRDSAAPANE
ncbi:MAG: hypothetical protein E6Q76_19705 [Rhizobium sp.]|nr:MAG: hypothetical protein E6Q76_19705 [Rhizobium sp.]